MLENRAQERSRHRPLDIHGGEQGFKVDRVVSVSLESDALERRGHHRFWAPTDLLIERFFVRHSTEASLGQELAIFNAAGVRCRSEDVSSSPAFIQLKQLVAMGTLGEVLHPVMSVVLSSLDRDDCARNQVLTVEVIQTQNEPAPVWCRVS